MKHAGASSRTVLPASLDAEARAFLADCQEAHATVQCHVPLFSTLRAVVAYGHRYDDKVAACPCRDLRLFLYADLGYTVCAVHGLQEIGRLNRPLSNGRPT